MVCQFVEALPHIKGEWARRREPLQLEDWQCFFVCVVFGWKRIADGLRRFRIAYLEVARKNAKSTLLAALALFLLTADGEAGAEVYSLATTKEQAKAVYDVSREMAKRETEFCQAFGVTVPAHSIIVEESASKMQALSSEANNLDGLNVHGAIVDELHAHRTREVWDVIETATGSRSQPLLVAITTAGTNRAGICYEQRSYTTQILNATLRAHEGLGYRVDGSAVEDETYFGIIYTIDDEDDWTDERIWLKANPNYGVSVKIDDMRRLARKAMQLASAAPNFLTKRLNVWVNADSAWMDMRAWERAARPQMTLASCSGWECYLGMDLASKRDITAVMALFRKDGRYRLFGRYYLPEETIEDSDISQYRGWAEVGHLIATDGNVIDEDVIRKDVMDWVSDYSPQAIAFDPGHGWNFCQRLKNDGLPMVEISANVLNYSEPMKELEKLVLSGKIEHDGNPVLSWMVSNVVCHRDAKDNIYPRKQREEQKIDGVVGALLALRVGAFGEGDSVYEERGIFSL